MSIKICYGFHVQEPVPLQPILNACVGKGWHKLIRNLVKDLYALGWDGRVYQIKEKFGGLRFYIGEGTDAIHARITEAEKESVRTCEISGKLGKIRAGGWLKCLSDECANGRPVAASNTP